MSTSSIIKKAAAVAVLSASLAGVTAGCRERDA
jgi:hypothetical protein